MQRQILIALFILLTSLLFAPSVFAQSDRGQDRNTAQEQSQEQRGGPERNQDAAQEEESIVTETHRKVWRLEAEAAISRFDFTEEQNQQIIEKFIEVRAKHLDASDYYRDEWRKQRARMLEQARQTGGVGAGFFDESELQRNLARVTSQWRQRLARALVQILEKEQAEELYPWLGGFDVKFDALVRTIMEFELDTQTTRDAAVEVLDYQVTLARILQKHIERANETGEFDRVEHGRERQAARHAFLKNLDEHLDDDQLEQIARLVGTRLKAD